MSKQRPWGTMFEAQVSYGLKYEQEAFDKLKDYISGFSKLYVDMRLPHTLCNNSWIQQFWWCLCRLYGNQEYIENQEHSITASYIPKQNLQICLDDLEMAIYQVTL